VFNLFLLRVVAIVEFILLEVEFDVKDEKELREFVELKFECSLLLCLEPCSFLSRPLQTSLLTRSGGAVCVNVWPSLRKESCEKDNLEKTEGLRFSKP